MERKQWDNSGILFRNDRKTESTHSDYRGSATVDGVEYWLNGWIRDNERGKFLKLSLKPKEKKQEETKLKVVGGNDFDDDIPF